MPKQSMPIREAERIARRLADEMQFEFVDIELVKEPTGRFLRFFIDRADGITINEVEAYHRKLHPLVEMVDYDFMEVSSPGADRPLKTEHDFERAAGMRVEAKTYKPVMGAKHFIGTLVGLADGAIEMKSESGDLIRLDRKDVAIIRPLIEFDEDDLKDDAPVGE